MESVVDAALRELRDNRVSGSAPEEAAALHRVGEAYAAEGQLTEAIRWFHQAVSAYAALENLPGCEAALSNVGVLLSRQSNWSAAEDVLRRVLDSARQRGDQTAEADACFNLSFILLRQGQLAEAKSLGERSAQLFRERQDTLNLGLALGNIGKVERAAGNLEEALVHQIESVTLLERAGADRDRAEAMSNLGNVYRDMGEPELARQCFRSALEVLGSDAEPRTRAGALLNLGTVQDDPEALESFRTARELFHRGEDKYGEAIALLNAGQLEMMSTDDGTRTAGRRHLDIARDLLVNLGAPEAEHAMSALAEDD